MEKLKDFAARERQARLDPLQAERMRIPQPQVIEDDPETSWELWQQALLSQEQQSRQ
jgi:hypothetical protein